uniref:Uncharacterized protein n=1 Tax=Utricularia reniformis TaxID=192314 RepID=A0A1Y0B2K8_9LAMI|nr:hypothetical protein AEK19_MT1393 [Utricularia reniformis]ART31589.1 hypothetical protein AEK19_MT1393 [Utricularia reniformis]
MTEGGVLGIYIYTIIGLFRVNYIYFIVKSFLIETLNQNENKILVNE